MVDLLGKRLRELQLAIALEEWRAAAAQKDTRQWLVARKHVFTDEITQRLIVTSLEASPASYARPKATDIRPLRKNLVALSSPMHASPPDQAKRA
jgi:hypothetical protein